MNNITKIRAKIQRIINQNLEVNSVQWELIFSSLNFNEKKLLICLLEKEDEIKEIETSIIEKNKPLFYIS